MDDFWTGYIIGVVVYGIVVAMLFLSLGRRKDGR